MRLSKWIAIVTSGDISLLAIEGNPPQPVLDETWMELTSQFQEAMPGKETGYFFSLMKKVASFKIKHTYITEILYVFKMVYDERLIEQLQLDDYDYPFTRESYLDDIEKVENELRCEQLEIDQAEEELNGWQYESDKPTEKTFYSTLTKLQKYFGINTPITRWAEEISVFDFSVYCTEYQAHFDKLKKDNEPQHGEP